jgi:hypothetical protein
VILPPWWFSYLKYGGVNVKITIRGDAFKLLEDFIDSSTGLFYKDVIRSLYYNEDVFLKRVRFLDKAVKKAKLENKK